MTGAEVVAIVSVSIGGMATLLSTCFHSRCSDIETPCIKCKREVLPGDGRQGNEVVARPVV